MDWQAILTAVVILAGGGSLAGLAWWIKIGRTLEGRGAERFANDWHQKVIARQDEEAKRLRDELQSLRDQRRQDQDSAREARDLDKERFAALQAEYLSFKRKQERENVISQEVSRAVIKDLRTIKSPDITEDRLETTIYISGLGPLD